MKDQFQIKNRVPKSWEVTSLADIARINPKISPNGIDAETEVTFLPMKLVEEVSGRYNGSYIRRFSEVSRGYTHFSDGDVIFAKITPCMENGKVAIVESLRNGLGFGSTEFHVVRLEGELPRKFLFYYLIREGLRQDARKHMTGSAGQLRVPSSYLENLALPFPPLPEQHRIVAKIEELFTKLDAGVKALNELKMQLKRYRQSVLQSAFEGKLTAKWREEHQDELEPATMLLERLKEERKNRCLMEQRESLRWVMESQIRNSSAADAPDNVMRDFLIEMVLQDLDVTHNNLIDSVVAAYLHAVSDKMDINSLTKNYLRWLHDSMIALQNDGLESKVLQAQLAGWNRYINEELNPKTPRRTLTPILGAEYSMFDSFKQWLVTSSIESQGIGYVRRKFLEEPAKTNWEKSEAKRKTSELDSSSFPELPNGWVWAKLEELAAEEPNSITDGPFGSNLKTSHYTAHGPRVIRLQNIGDVRFVDEIAHISSAHFDKLRKYEIFSGDIVIASLGSSPPRSCIIPESVGPAIVKADCIRFRSHSLMNNRWINFALNSDSTRKWGARAVHGVGRPRLGLHNVRNIPIPVPAAMEQAQIVSEIERRFSLIDAIESIIEGSRTQSNRLRQSILERAFEGKLVPQNPTDEPAEKLLDRIKFIRAEART